MLDFPTIEEAPAVAPEVASEVVDRAQIVNGTPLVKYSATEAGLLALKAELAGKVYDLKTTKGDQAARADRLRCVTLRTTLEKRRKDFKAPALAYGKLIDTEAARITAEIEALEAPIDAQIKADEQRRAAEKEERERLEREAAEKHAARRSAIAMYALRCQEVGMTAERIAAGMQRLQDADMGDPEVSRAAELVHLRDKTLETMRTLHAQAVAREQEAARQEAIRQENERVAAENAREAQRIAAEAAEIRRQAAELAAREAAAREAAEKAAEDAIVASIHANSRRIEGDASGYVQKAISYFEAGACDFEDDTRPRVREAINEGRRHLAERLAAAMDTERQESQQVLKAEPPPADATDRDTPATASPSVGSMGAGQAADAAPAAVVAESATTAPRVVLLEEPEFDPAAELQALAAEARASRFPSQPKMGVEWWARFYAIAEAAA